MDALLWDHSASFLVSDVIFWNTARDGSKTCYTTLLVHSDCVRNDTCRKAFSSSKPRRNVFILSSNILALIFLNWHARLLPSHTLYFAKRPHRTILLYLPFAFRPAVLHLLVDTLYRVYASVVQIICLHPITQAVSGHFVS